MSEKNLGLCDSLEIAAEIATEITKEFGTELTPPPAKAKKPLLVPLSTVEPKEASYLIEPYLPQGMLAIMGGVSGVGKTYLAMNWIASISNGKPLPFMDKSYCTTQGYTYYFTQENDANIVIQPRLASMGADLSKIMIQNIENGDTYEPLTMNDSRLEELAKEYPPSLIVFDPIQSYLGDKVGMNKANEVRPILDWLGNFAKRHNCTILLISHMSKPSVCNTAALDRLLGSSDFRNAARSIIIVGKDPENSESHVFAHAKNSIGTIGESQRFHIETGIGIVYDGECDLTADDIVKQANVRTRNKPSATLTYTMDRLETLMEPEGYIAYEEVEKLIITGEISRGTMYNARVELGIQSVRVGKPPNRKTWWLRADIDKEKFKSDHTPTP